MKKRFGRWLGSDLAKEMAEIAEIYVLRLGTCEAWGTNLALPSDRESRTKFAGSVRQVTPVLY